MVNGQFGCWTVSWFCMIATVSSKTTPITPSVQPESEAELTCYTCVNVSDNLICNQYAIDHPCPQGQDFCHTLHIMDSTGASVVVNKKCANSTECWPLGVGCLHIDAQTVCVSCCDDMYCNVTVPTNKSNAVFSNKRAKRRRKAQPTTSCCPPKAQDFSLVFLAGLLSVTVGTFL